MARKARVEFPGAVYHVLDRGDRREPIFRDDQDRRRFLATLGEVCARTGWRMHAFVLMSNHYHFMLETPEPNLVAGMRWFQTTWTVRFNRRHRLSGHLFQGRYKAVLVEAAGYWAVLSDYIHLNPVRAGIVGLGERLFDYRWSSYPLYCACADRPVWFEAQQVLGELGLKDDAAGRRHYARRMRQRAEEELSGRESAEVAELRRGWCLGSPDFRERMLQRLDAAAEKLPARRARQDAVVEREHGVAEARRLLVEGLRIVGIEEGALAGLKKGDARKLAIAVLIRQRTAVPSHWIAEALHLGHVSRLTHASQSLQRMSWTSKLEAELT